ncbi:MFS transporter [Ferrimonas balearica]|nr:MFS transporter [Ferrimonas balearica]
MNDTAQRSPASSPSSSPGSAGTTGPDPQITRAAWATRAVFFATGFITSCWAPLIPFVKTRVGADESTFGLLLLCLGGGALLAMPLAGALAAKLGARAVIAAAGLAMIPMLPLLTLMPSVLLLGVALALFGAFLNSVDVAMNIHAVEVERRAARPIMSGLHALYSVGSFSGAGAMALMLLAGLAPSLAATLGAAAAAAALLLALRGLLRARGGTDTPAFAWPRGVVLLLAALSGISFLVEGAMLDWGALLAIERQLLPVEGAGLGYMVFAAAMVTARLIGDRVISRLGQMPVLLGGSLLAVAGIALLIAAPWTPLALAGYALTGFGVANMVPIFFSAAGRQRVMPPALAIASISTTGYAGVLMGPAVLGFAAEATSLATTFGALALVLLLIPASARAVTHL